MSTNEERCLLNSWNDYPVVWHATPVLLGEARIWLLEFVGTRLRSTWPASAVPPEAIPCPLPMPESQTIANAFHLHSFRLKGPFHQTRRCSRPTCIAFTLESAVGNVLLQPHAFTPLNFALMGPMGDILYLSGNLMQVRVMHRIGKWIIAAFILAFPGRRVIWIYPLAKSSIAITFLLWHPIYPNLDKWKSVESVCQQVGHLNDSLIFP